MSKKYIDKSSLLYIKDKKLLVSRSYGKDIWYIPGGKREKGETYKQTLIREIKEELNVDLMPKTIKYFGIFEAPAHGKPEETFVRTKCYTAEFKGEIKPTSEIEKIDFINYSQKSQSAILGQYILEDLKKKGLID